MAVNLNRSLVADAGFPGPFVDPRRKVARLLLGPSLGEVLPVRFGNKVPSTVVGFDVVIMIQVEFRVDSVNPLVDDIVLLVGFSVKSHRPVTVRTFSSRDTAFDRPTVPRYAVDQAPSQGFVIEHLS